jgi:hypothetical protein
MAQKDQAKSHKKKNNKSFSNKNNDLLVGSLVFRESHLKNDDKDRM